MAVAQVFDVMVRLAENSFVMSLAILVLLVLGRVTRNKVSARVRYGCWLAVAVGLLLPVRPVLWTVPLPEGVGTAMARVEAETVAPAGDVISVADEEAANEAAYGNGYAYGRYTGIEPFAQPYTADTGFLYKPLYETESVSPLVVITQTAQMLKTSQAFYNIPWQSILPLLWCGGVLSLLSLYIIKHIIVMKRFRRWGEHLDANSHVHGLLFEVCREINLKRLPRLLTCPITTTPIITGLFRPLLILPAEAIESTKPDDVYRLRLMLLHEALHIKRGDMWARLLVLAATAAHWFNPLVYLMNRAVHTEAELACDGLVLRYAGDGARWVYGKTVMDSVRRTKSLFATALASAMSGEGRNLKRRLKNIIERKHTRRGLAVFCAALIIGGVLLAGSLAYESRDGNDNTGTPHNTPAGNEQNNEGDGEGDTNNPTPAAAPAMPEPTDALVIYAPAYWEFNRRFLQAVTVFRQTYPEVDFTFERIGEHNDRDGIAYAQRVGTELMAGMGSDIILTHYFHDAHSPMRNGIFKDLSFLWDNDPDFTHKNQLNHTVMDAGVYRGRRYVIPLSYTMEFVWGERGMLDRIGFDTEGDMDILSFLNRINEALPRGLEAYPLFQGQGYILSNFLHGYQIGIPLVDYEQRIVLPYKDEIRAFMEVYKEISDFEWEIRIDGLINNIILTTNSINELLTQGVYMFIAMPSTFSALQGYSTLRSGGYDPVLFALRDRNGEHFATVSQIVAVRADSPNYVNAWRFIQILLSEGIQDIGTATANINAFQGLVVNNAARESVIRQDARLFPYGAFPMTALQTVFDLIDSVTQVELPNRAIGGFFSHQRHDIIHGIFSDIMWRYRREGSIDIDTAMTELERRLWFYLTE